MRRLCVWTLGAALGPVATGLSGNAVSTTQTRPAAAVRPAAKQPAERLLRLGVQASYGGDSDFGIGARVTRKVGGGLTLIGSFDYFFPSDTEGAVGVKKQYWEANGNLVYPLAEPLGLYAGAGLNLAHPSAELSFLDTRTAASETNLGLNVLAGLKRGYRSSLQLFGEAKYEIKGGEQFVLSVGVLF